MSEDFWATHTIREIPVRFEKPPGKSGAYFDVDGQMVRYENGEAPKKLRVPVLIKPHCEDSDMSQFSEVADEAPPVPEPESKTVRIHADAALCAFHAASYPQWENTIGSGYNGRGDCAELMPTLGPNGERVVKLYDTTDGKFHLLLIPKLVEMDVL
jgi:hypothetical protein